MRRAIRQILVLTAILAAFPATAVADAPDDAIRDCMADGSVDRAYSDSVYQQAISRIQGDRAVYGDCAAIFNSLIGSSGGPKAKAAGKDGAADAVDEKLTPAERRARAKQAKERRKNRQIASIDDVAPGGDDPLQVDEASDSGMPLPLLLTLILLACLAAGGGVWYAARRNPAFANALRRVPLPGRRS